MLSGMIFEMISQMISGLPPDALWLIVKAGYEWCGGLGAAALTVGCGRRTGASLVDGDCCTAIEDTCATHHRIMCAWLASENQPRDPGDSIALFAYPPIHLVPTQLSCINSSIASNPQGIVGRQSSYFSHWRFTFPMALLDSNCGAGSAQGLQIRSW